MHLDRLLATTVSQGASDLHLRVGYKPKIRVHGDLKSLNTVELDAETLYGMLKGFVAGNVLDQMEENKQADFAATLDGVGRFRVNVFKDRHGTGAVFRTLPQKTPTIDEMGLPKVLYKLASLPHGLVLVTGATGSGKSTTLAAMVDYINSTTRKHILTIEDPIEFVHEPKKALVTQREVGKSATSFANAIKSGLREDPDVILVGEMRDLESISNALTAAETGHLVLATLHSNTAHSTINRIIDVFPEGEQNQVKAMLANTLAGVVSQRLFPRIDQPGRAAAHEIMIGTSSIRNHIRLGKLEQAVSSIQTGAKHGMITMDKSIEQLVQAGKIEDPQKVIERMSDLSNPANDLGNEFGEAAPGAG